MSEQIKVIEATVTYTCPVTKESVTTSATELVVEHTPGDGQFENDQDDIVIWCPSCGHSHLLKGY